MKKEALLKLYQIKHPEVDHIEAWQFGGNPDKLADLVMKGIKTATCSCKNGYGEDEPIPQEGELSIILNSQEEAVCIIKTNKVVECKYKDVTADHAFKEGEGDRTLDYWQQVHWDFFTQESQQYHYEFNEDSILICEEFEVVMKGE